MNQCRQVVLPFTFENCCSDVDVNTHKISLNRITCLKLLVVVFWWTSQLFTLIALLESRDFKTLILYFLSIRYPDSKFSVSCESSSKSTILQYQSFPSPSSPSQLFNLSRSDSGRRHKVNINFFFTLLCGASKGFMKA